MTIVEFRQKPENSRCDLRLAPPLPQSQLAEIKRYLHLTCNKWDTQVGDVSVIHEQPLVLPRHEWDWLCSAAERLALETIRAETILLEARREDLRLGLPRPMWKLMLPIRRDQHPPDAFTRAMRFDFHPTKNGWRVSEINSDVPGGWTEASTLPVLYRSFYGDLAIPPSPLDAWIHSMRRTANGKRVALLSAPGFLEDQQVIFAFMRRLEGQKIPCSVIHSPGALAWSSGGSCSLRGTSEQIGAIVRFFQIEWLCRLPRKTGWKDLLKAGATPVTNPTVSAISESKRFPLTLNDPSAFPAWQQLVPECRDPRDVAPTEWDDWVLKKTYSNAGDEIHLCGALGKNDRSIVLRKALQKPLNWIAQRRFETLPVESVHGMLRPCVGVFVVDGKAAGAYIRLSESQVTGGAARESAMFIESVSLNE